MKCSTAFESTQHQDLSVSTYFLLRISVVLITLTQLLQQLVLGLTHSLLETD